MRSKICAMSKGIWCILVAVVVWSIPSFGYAGIQLIASQGVKPEVIKGVQAAVDASVSYINRAFSIPFDQQAEITIYIDGSKNENIAGTADAGKRRIVLYEKSLIYTKAWLTEVVAHEVFHEYQFQLAGRRAFTYVPTWLLEGAANVFSAKVVDAMGYEWYDRLCERWWAGKASYPEYSVKVLTLLEGRGWKPLGNYFAGIWDAKQSGKLSHHFEEVFGTSESALVYQVNQIRAQLGVPGTKSSGLLPKGQQSATPTSGVSTGDPQKPMIVGLAEGTVILQLGSALKALKVGDMFEEYKVVRIDKDKAELDYAGETVVIQKQ